MKEVAPTKLLFPEGRNSDSPLVVTATTSDGLTGGDRLLLSVTVDPGATATIVPQAADRLYRALPDEDPSQIETHITIGEDGRCEWLAQEAVLFDGSRMYRSLNVDLAPDARILAMKMVILGCDDMGEPYSGGLIHDAWHIRRGGHLIWADALHLDSDFITHGPAPFGRGMAQAVTTLVYAGPDAADHLYLAQTLVDPPEGSVTCFDGLLVLRMVRDDPQALRKDVIRAAGLLRAAIFGVSPYMPPICYC